MSTPRVNSTPADLRKDNHSDFVDREREKQEMLDGVHDALAGKARFFTLSGEPGIGKTRLSDEVAKAATALGMQAAWGRCWEGGGAPAYWPWVQVLRLCVKLWEPKYPLRSVGEGAEYISGLIGGRSATPERSGESLRSVLPSGESSDPSAQRFRLFDSINMFLRSVASDAPLLIVLDDLHAADQESILLLHFLIRAIRSERIMIVACYREAEVRVAPHLAKLFGEVSREARSITLRGLSKASTKEFVASRSAVSPDEALIAALYKATSGNPFFLSEIVQLLLAEARLQHTEDLRISGFRVPETVRSAIRRRLDSASAGTRDVLRVAAVIGHDFDFALAQHLCPSHEQGLAARLDDAIQLGLVEEVSGAVGRYRFSHMLIAEALRDELPKTQRQQLHLQLAETLERSQSDRGVDDLLPEIAHHYFRAHPLAPAEKAISYASRAAGRVMRSFAYEEASRLYQMALSVQETATKSDQRLRCELLLALGDAQARALDFARFKATFTEAARISRAIGNSEFFARAVLGYGQLWSDAYATDHEMVSLLREALVQIGTDDSALRAVLLARLAEELRWSAPDPDTTAIVNDSVAVAERLRHPGALMEALFMKLQLMRGNPDTAEDRLALVNEMLQIIESHGLEDWLGRIHYSRGSVFLELGRIVDVHREIEALEQLPKALRHGTMGLGFAEIVAAMRALIEGRVAEAEQAAVEAVTVASQRPNSTADQIFTAQILEVRRAQGRLGEIAPMLGAFIARYPLNRLARCAYAFCCAHTGDQARARAEFEALAAGNFGGIPRDFTWLGSMAYLAETCAALEDCSQADVLYRILLPYSTRNASLGFFSFLGSVAHHLGRLATLASQFNDAEQHFEAALRSHRSMGALPWLTRTQYHFAEMLLKRGGPGDQKRALSLLDSVLEITESIGLKLVHEDAEALRLRVLSAPAEGEREDAAHAASSMPLGNIFRRDGDVWTLVYQGKLCHVRDIKGLSYITHLLRHPGVEFHSLDIVASLEAIAPCGSDTDLEQSGTKGRASDERLAEAGLRRGIPVDAGELLDAQAKAEYGRRISELREEQEDAVEIGNSERAAAIQEEIDAVAAELSRAVGLGGRDRKAASLSERARLNVTRAIKAAIEKIADSNPDLAHLLRRTIRTGTFCCYLPDPKAPVAFEF